MSVPFTCPSCGTTGKAPDDKVGQWVRCPRCKKTFTLEGLPSTADELSEGFLGPFEVSSPTRRQSSGSGALWAVLVVLLLLVGVVMVAVTVISGPASIPRGEEPRYKGQPVSHWIEQLADFDEQRSLEAEIAIGQIGAPAIPYLKREIQGNGPAKNRASEILKWIRTE